MASLLRAFICRCYYYHCIRKAVVVERNKQISSSTLILWLLNLWKHRKESSLCSCFCSWGSGRKHFMAQRSVILPVWVVFLTKIDGPCCLHFEKSSWGKQNNHLRWSARSGHGRLEVVEALSKIFTDLAEKSSCQRPLYWCSRRLLSAASSLSRAAGRTCLPPPVTVDVPVFPLGCLRPFPVETEDMGRRKDIFGNVSPQSVFFTRLPQLQNVKGKKKEILELTPDRP